MSNSGSSSTWMTFLSDLPITGSSAEVTGEQRFHREFKQACIIIGERDPERLLARFLRHHDQIVAFVSALDESMGLDDANSLSSVFWSKAFEAIESLDSRMTSFENTSPGCAT
ncbi:hypothetical protein BDZ85DRAFT_132053 [Elsinoe ampelina]|uniref:Uncharacterized protein n=1 Tax=Elsinoe ampelina TaxID=302913 RepID=A0A6A6G7N0_9PEZI|nr:hypothetical protein BDZ85DRAFT_132053 [Elsinoe ampelina]